MPPGLFVVGTDTGVGKTAVSARIIRNLAAAGVRVGPYKPVTTGLAAVDAAGGDPLLLWEAAGRPGELTEVSPQVFVAPISPPRSSRAEGRRVDERLLREGLAAWSHADVVVVEGAGGLFSPLGDRTLGVDLARDLGLPLVIVDAARLGGIGRTLCCVRAARAEGLAIAACVFSEVRAVDQEVVAGQSLTLQTAADVAALIPDIPVTILGHGDSQFEPPLAWWRLAGLTVRG